MVKTPLPLQGARVQSLVWELGSHMLCGTAGGGGGWGGKGRNSCIGKDLQEAEGVVIAVKRKGLRLNSVDCRKKGTNPWIYPGNGKGKSTLSPSKSHTLTSKLLLL